MFTLISLDVRRSTRRACSFASVMHTITQSHASMHTDPHTQTRTHIYMHARAHIKIQKFIHPRERMRPRVKPPWTCLAARGDKHAHPFNHAHAPHTHRPAHTHIYARAHIKLSKFIHARENAAAGETPLDVLGNTRLMSADCKKKKSVLIKSHNQ